MATQRQIEANQRNAQLSSGPKTEAGKAVASLNALRHGLLASQAVLPGESASDFEELEKKLYDQLMPVGEVESAVVNRIVMAIWRLDRARKFETGILLWHLESNLKTKKRLYDIGVDTKRPEKLESASLATLGEAYSDSKDALANLARYETSHDKSLYRALRELERCQAARRAARVRPITVDLNVSEHVVPKNCDTKSLPNEPNSQQVQGELADDR